jgi:hypothetical protein
MSSDHKINKNKYIELKYGIIIIKYIYAIIQKNLKNKKNQIHDYNNDILNKLSNKSEKINIPKNKSKKYLIDDTQELNFYMDSNFSHYYDVLLQIIPDNTKSREHLIELIKNKNHKIKYQLTNSDTTHGKFFCCNPDCKIYLELPQFFAYDGTYCSTECRNLAQEYIGEYWYNV